MVVYTGYHVGCYLGGCIYWLPCWLLSRWVYILVAMLVAMVLVNTSMASGDNLSNPSGN